MRNALPVLALAALFAAPALAVKPGPPQSEQNPGPPTSPGADVQIKPGPPSAPGAAPGANKLLPAVRPPNPNRGQGVPPPDADKDAGTAVGENKLLPAVQAPGMAGMEGMAGNQLPAVQAPGADVQIQPGPPSIGGSKLPAIQAPSPADIGSDRFARPPPQNMPGGIGGMGAAGFRR